MRRKYAEPPDLSEEALAEFKLMQQLEGNHALTILYVIVEVGRSFVDEPLHHDVRTTLGKSSIDHEIFPSINAGQSTKTHLYCSF